MILQTKYNLYFHCLWTNVSLNNSKSAPGVHLCISINHNSLTSRFSGADTQAVKEKKEKPQHSAPLVDNSIAPNLG